MPIRRLLGFPAPARLVSQVMEIRIQTSAVALPLRQVVPWVTLLVVDTLVHTSYYIHLTLARLWSVPVQIALGSHQLALAVKGSVIPSWLTRMDRAHVLYIVLHYSRMLMHTMLKVFLQVC